MILLLTTLALITLIMINVPIAVAIGMVAVGNHQFPSVEAYGEYYRILESHRRRVSPAHRVGAARPPHHPAGAQRPRDERERGGRRCRIRSRTDRDRLLGTLLRGARPRCCCRRAAHAHSARRGAAARRYA